jgi:phosphoenolpyruvate---glycerone phosphotransferase subunit DhaK
MKKIINQPDQFVDEVIDALFLAHPGWIKAATADRRALVRADAPKQGHVGIVTGGGSGHMPSFLGYVGEGLCSGVAVGNVFSSPSSEQIFEATKAVNGGAGVLYVYGNYGGDVFNFDLAADLAELEDIAIKTVVLTDDVASAQSARSADRRGVAGMVFAFKCAGAAAERGDSLDEVARITAKANNQCRTMGVGLSPTILPAAGKPTFTLPDGEMEIGIGIHGEPGTHRGKLETADEIATRLTGEILRDLAAPKGSRVAVLVNGLGATPLEELYLLYRRSAALIAEQGLTIARSYVGEYVTSLEMAGASITIMLVDDELEALLAAPARSPFFREWSQV